MLIFLTAATAANAQTWKGDPVQPLTDEEAVALKTGLSDDKVGALLDAFVGRAEAAFTEKCEAPEGLLEWFGENPEVQRAFWLAISPGHDDVKTAMNIIDSIRLAYPDKVVKYMHLAVAISVVWDTPRAVKFSQRNCIFAVKAEQFSAIPDPMRVFYYFTDDKNIKKFLFKPDQLVWPIMVHLVDFDVSYAESKWALDKFTKQKKNIGSTYQMVEYDHGKRDRGVTKLGSNPYTLPNLLKFGGVCGDQAHFCSRVAKCLGIPAMKASGLSRYGGAGHAFTCFFVFKKKRPVLESTGRYFNDFYYTGNVFDPQTATRILDRTVAMMLDGASLSYDKYMLSNTLARIAGHVYDDHPIVSLELTKKALTENYFCAPAWRTLMKHVSDGNMKPKEGLEWANILLKYLTEHPDLTLECVSTFIDCIPYEETKTRQNFYNRVAKVYEDRPDLLIDLRVRQGKELQDAGREGELLGLYLSCAADLGKEGRLIMPIVEPAVEILRNRKKIDKRALPFLEKLVKKFPKSRGGRLAKSFVDLAQLLIPIFEAAGDKKGAAKLRRQAGL
jgi:hypothetical protein